jgi:hypothetical protein
VTATTHPSPDRYPMEHRWGDRLPVAVGVRVGPVGRALRPGWLLDVSLSGARIWTSAALSVVTLVDVELMDTRLMQYCEYPAPLRGRVVRRGPMQIGLEWEEFASETVCVFMRIAASAHNRRSACDTVPALPGRLSPMTTRIVRGLDCSVS